MRFKPSISKYLATCVLLSITFVCGVGCESHKEPALVGPTPPGSIQTSPPAESFKNIVTQFRRAVADKPGGFVHSHEGSFSRLQFRREVEDELIPPENEGDNYKGRVTVVTKFSYRYRPPLEDADAESDRREKSSNNRDSSRDLDGPPIESLNSLGKDYAATTEKNRKGEFAPKTVGVDTEDEEVKSYDLAYEGDRWVLKTKPDPTTDQLISEAFAFVLKYQ
jgi:hypothetical protein